MSINTIKLNQPSIADLWSLLKYSEDNYHQFEAESQRLNDEEAKEKALHHWRIMVSFSSEFEERVRQLTN